MAYKCCGRVVLTISEVKPFLAGKLCQVNFRKFSSLTSGGQNLKSMSTPSSLTTSSHVKFTDSMLKAGCISNVFFFVFFCQQQMLEACIQLKNAVYTAVKPSHGVLEQGNLSAVVAVQPRMTRPDMTKNC